MKFKCLGCHQFGLTPKTIKHLRGCRGRSIKQVEEVDETVQLGRGVMVCVYLDMDTFDKIEAYGTTVTPNGRVKLNMSAGARAALAAAPTTPPKMEFPDPADKATFRGSRAVNFRLSASEVEKASLYGVSTDALGRMKINLSAGVRNAISAAPQASKLPPAASTKKGEAR